MAHIMPQSPTLHRDIVKSCHRSLRRVAECFGRDKSHMTVAATTLSYTDGGDITDRETLQRELRLMDRCHRQKERCHTQISQTDRETS